MSLTFERVVQEDIEVGTSTGTVTNPGGGTLSSTQFGIHTMGVGQNAYTMTWSPGGITTLSYATTDITVSGASVGDFVLASHNKMLTNDLMISGHVSAADTVTVIIFNPTAGTLTPASGTLKVLVMKSR